MAATIFRKLSRGGTPVQPLWLILTVKPGLQVPFVVNCKFEQIFLRILTAPGDRGIRATRREHG
jgi:hypothetical protein